MVYQNVIFVHANVWTLFEMQRGLGVHVLMIVGLQLLKAVINIKLQRKKGFLITLCPASACLSVNIFFVITFSSFYLKQVGGFQPNLAQYIFGWRKFKFLSIKGHVLRFTGEKFENYWKIVYSFQKSSRKPFGQKS